jgi:hypothetical protein
METKTIYMHILIDLYNLEHASAVANCMAELKLNDKVHAFVRLYL